MAQDIQTQIVGNIKKCKYVSLEMDEFTDISNYA